MELPFTCDYAKSNRAICRGCDTNIIKNTCRVAIMLQSRSFDSKIPNWYHAPCFFIEHMPEACNEIEKFTSLNWEDRKEIEEIIEKGESPYASDENRIKIKRVISVANSKASINIYKIDCAKNNQTKCECCDTFITKSEVRIMKKVPKKKEWYHPKCLATIHTTMDFLEPGSSIPGFEKLSADDQELVQEILPGIEDEVPAKKIRLSTDTNSNLTNKDLSLKESTDIMYAYRKSIKEHLKKEEIASLLQHNCQSVPKGIDSMVDAASEMLTFGALERCTSCFKGQLIFTNLGYKCLGSTGKGWPKCTAFTDDPRRMSVDIPLELKLRHTFLYQYEYFERKREMPKFKAKKNSDGPLKNKNFILAGFANEEKSVLHSKIKKLGGRVVTEVRRSVFAIIGTENEVQTNTSDIQKSKEFQVYVLKSEFLHEIWKTNFSLDDLAKKHSLVNWGSELHNRVPEKYLKNGPAKSLFNVRRGMEEEEGKRRIRIKGGVAIEPDSGLDHIAHVYKSGDVIFNAILSRTNVTSNKNSYYKIQLLEADTGDEYWVYRSWGRIGTSVGSCKTEEIKTLAEAKIAFKDCFKEITGRTWDNRFYISNRPGQYTMLEVNYDARKEEIQDLGTFVADSSLKPAVAELMSIIFNTNSMEKMMLEYQLDLKKMPLGKLSRSQIKAAYQILNQANWALQKKRVRKQDIIDVTNMFYSHMPHNAALERPPLLDNVELIKQKSEMLENLMELETAYAMIQRGAEAEGGNILDGYYRQLNTDIEVINENSDEYRMIQEYVHNTHGDTHRNYDLKILEAFNISRHGEDERYKPFKNLNNRRLLWHGSRTTNFASILSQGLRIAPPEAPMSGYMFGKGIYFADMVSKSANYCFSKPDDTTGLLLLCEVALGNMVNKKIAEHITRLPNGHHSVRGVGKTEPDPYALKTLEDGLQVPLGKPILDLDADQCNLLYNEYIVYDIAQVNIKYLLKMDFKFKNRAY